MVPFAMPSKRCRMPATRGTWSAEAIFEIPIRTGEAIVDLVEEKIIISIAVVFPASKAVRLDRPGGGAF
jgi:hypothetical protein